MVAENPNANQMCDERRKRVKRTLAVLIGGDHQLKMHQLSKENSIASSGYTNRNCTKMSEAAQLT
jgi:uncharacterized protein (UPF0218 family)